MLPPLPIALESTANVAREEPQELPGNPKIFFPIIDNGLGSVKANFMVCCVAALAGYDVYMERYSDSLIPRARNRAAAKFLKGKRDYLLFIDCDIIFSKDQIDCLMQHDEPIVCGIYCKKEKEVAPCLNLLPENSAIKTGGLAEIKRGGTGFMRIHRSVLDAMKEDDSIQESRTKWWKAPIYNNHGGEEWDFFATGVKDREYLSEDWFFCDRARELGFKVMLDTRIQTKHEGTAFFPTDEAVQRQAEKEKSITDEHLNWVNNGAMK